MTMKTINQIKHILVEELDKIRLRHKRSVSIKKKDTVRVLDEEISPAIADSKLEDEIEQTDDVREQIELMIAQIDTSLDRTPPSEVMRPCPLEETPRTVSRTSLGDSLPPTIETLPSTSTADTLSVVATESTTISVVTAEPAITGSSSTAVTSVTSSHDP